MCQNCTIPPDPVLLLLSHFSKLAEKHAKNFFSPGHFWRRLSYWSNSYWEGTTVWLADRDQRETKLLLSNEMRGGLETKLKTVPKYFYLYWGSSFLGRLQAHTEPIQSHHPLIPITFNITCYLTPIIFPVSPLTMHSRRFRRGGERCPPNTLFPHKTLNGYTMVFPHSGPLLKLDCGWVLDKLLFMLSVWHLLSIQSR